jgi:hypothetical protein
VCVCNISIVKTNFGLFSVTNSGRVQLLTVSLSLLTEVSPFPYLG